MEYGSYRSLPAMFFEVARQRGDQPFLWAKKDREYRPLAWAAAADSVARLADGLAAIGIEPGDRVVLVSENRPEWAIADLAIMSIGAITVPAYVTNTVEDHRHILRNSGARAAIVSTTPLLRRVVAAASEVPGIAVIVALDADAAVTGAVPVIGWEDVLRQGRAGESERRVAMLGPDDPACIIHTSGTGGAPKGVIQTHRNIIANCYGAYRLLQSLDLKDETFLSFLPLSHAYEHTAGLMFPISLGAEIYFTHGADTLSRDLLEVRPTLMTAVPRLYETLYQRIQLGMQREGRPKRLLFDRAVAIGRKRLARESLSTGERLVDPLLEKFVREPVRGRFGGRLKAMISGGAPLNPEIGGFFLALGVRLLQGYGQSEAAPIICCNPPGRVKAETVGPPLADVRVRIAEDGEILVSGDNVMKGYWNDPNETARTVVENWLHTGDIGKLDGDGYLQITDRKRDFIKNSGGDMISPGHVEGALTMAPEIAQAMVFGDQRPYLVAVLVPEQEFGRSYAKASGIPADPAHLAQDAGFNKAVGDAVTRINQGLAVAERVRRFVIAPEPFTVENAQMTPTLKIRRHVIREIYRASLLQLYDGK